MTPTSTIIGIYTPDHVDPGFSFYNRGSILAASSNYNQDTTAFEIVGDGTALADLQGGLLNSGTISATVNTNSSASNATVASATAHRRRLECLFRRVGTMYHTYDLGCDCMEYSGLLGLNAKNLDDPRSRAGEHDRGRNGGTIIATASGPTSGNSATAISIGPGGTLPSIINSAA